MDRDARTDAVRLLARREHSVAELRHKLLARGHNSRQVADVLGALAGEGLLSDARFAEAFARSRIERGHGPVRISAELRQHEVDDALIARCFAALEVDWREQAARARRKRFGETLPGDYEARMRQARFLQYRGFDAGHIRQVLNDAAACGE